MADDHERPGAPRELAAGLRLLDRQLLDRDELACGKVDDVELTEADDGTVYASAILLGPGALLSRTGFTRLGGWLRRFAAASYPWPEDPGRVGFEHVVELGDHVGLDVSREDLATFAAERWVRDHVTGKIPGAGRADG
jgi:hypothetical protein